MFGVTDYIVGAFVLLVPVIIGFFFAYRDANKMTREEYLLGGRSMSLLPVSLSLFITFQSAITLIGVPFETITYGSMNLMSYVGFSLSFVVGAIVMVPLMYPLNITSIFEYMELRYKCRTVRLTCTCMGMINTIVYMSFALLAPASALEATVGLPIWLSVIIFGAIGTMYTALGGIKSVIWTDTFQTIIVLVGIVAMIIAGTVEVGGASEIWNISSTGGRLNFALTSVDPRVRDTYFGAIIGGALRYLIIPFSQSTMQRIASIGTLRWANAAYILNAPLLMCYGFALVIIGNVVYAYFAHKSCDPLKAGLISKGNQICPYFVVETLGHLPGMVGLYVSTLCCGALSTLSSGINSLAANTVEDVLAGPLASYKESTITLITKVLSVVYGVIIISLAYIAKDLQGSFYQVSLMITGAFSTPLVAIFLMSGAVPWANKYGAMSGLITGLGFNLLINFGRYFNGRPYDTMEPIPNGQCSSEFNNITTVLNQTLSVQSSTPTVDSQQGYGFFLFDLSFQWDVIFGTVVTIGAGLIASFLTNTLKNSGKTSERRLIIPLFRRLWDLPPGKVERTDLKVEAELMLSHNDGQV